MKKIVAIGFMFSPDLTEVVLIRKKKPSWQKDKLNGVGGKVEDKETPYHAMVREFEEEAGLPGTTWDSTLVIDGIEFQLHVFSCVNVDYYEVETKEEEKVDVYSVQNILNGNYNLVDGLEYFLKYAIECQKVKMKYV